MLASCGKSTPIGTWNVPATYRWLNMVDNSWGQWCTQIWGNYLFHSVPYYTHDNADLEWEEFNHLGETRSLGCVRLCCGDAKWIYDHCAVGTQVTITNDRPAGALEKPQGLQLEEWHTWDPTDPNAQSLCQAHGCSH